LEFQVKPLNATTSTLSQTAFFAPHGLTGLLYWYLLYPVHGFIFSGLAKQLARHAERGMDRPAEAIGPAVRCVSPPAEEP
jgi:hypothetical protein